MITTTLEWLKDNILKTDVISVTVTQDGLTVVTVSGSFFAAIANIYNVFNPDPVPAQDAQLPDDRWPVPKMSPRGGSTDARLWGG